MSCDDADALYIGNDVRLTLSSLHDPISGGNLITDASVTANVTDHDGNAVASVVLVYDVVASAYIGVLPHTTPLIAGDEYTIIYTATTIEGTVNQWTQKKTAKIREI